MKTSTLASSLLPVLLGVTSSHTLAAVITFDFLDLVENQSSNISGRLGNGADYSGVPLATSYQYFDWENQGLDMRVSTQREDWEDPDGTYPSGDYFAAFAFLQPDFAGLGTCLVASCAQASELNYLDKALFSFSEVVEIVNIGFSVGEDDSNRPEDYEDYRAYDGTLRASGGPDGAMYSLMGSRFDWNGSLVGNHLEFYRPEGTGAFIESITVRTADVPEPPIWALMALGLLLGYSRRRRESTTNVR